MLFKVLFLVFIVLAGNSYAQLDEAKEFYEIAKTILEAIGAVGDCEPPELSSTGEIGDLLDTTEMLKERLNEYKQTCPIAQKYSMILLYLVIRDHIIGIRAAYRNDHPDDGPAWANDPTLHFPDDYHQFDTGMCRRLLAVIAKQWDSCNTQVSPYVKVAYLTYQGHCSGVSTYRDCQYEWQSCAFGYNPDAPAPKLADSLAPSDACTFMGICEEIGKNVNGGRILNGIRTASECDSGTLALNQDPSSTNPDGTVDTSTPPSEDDSSAQAQAFVQDRAHLIKNRVNKRMIPKAK